MSTGKVRKAYRWCPILRHTINSDMLLCRAGNVLASCTDRGSFV